MFKINEYFDGKVASIGFQQPDGTATVGVMASTSSAPISWRSCR
jgi:uncharacterized protein YaiE (UPF0345 family)